MWSSGQNDGNNSRVISSSSSSSRSSSSSSILPPTPRRKTMEEVWKDITLTTSPLHHHNIHNTNPTTSSPSFRGMILQDFLAGPSKETPISSSAPSLDIPPPPPPATVLSLNTRLDFHYMDSSCMIPSSSPTTYHSNTHSNSNANSNSNKHNNKHNNNNNKHNNNNNNNSFMSPDFSDDAVIVSPSPVDLFSFCSKKRMLEEQLHQSSGFACGGERRHNRMIKNRESAARSRARKQAYTNELELEVAHLVDENSKLKRQNEKLRLAMAAQFHTGTTLQRTLTAPF